MRKYAIFLAALVFVGLFASCGNGGLDARNMSVFRVDGDTVIMSNHRGAAAHAMDGARLSEGYAVVTGLESFCYILLDTDSLVKMDMLTGIAVERLTDSLLRIIVGSGQVLVNVQNQEPGHTLETRIGNTAIAVRGTMFVAGVYPAGEAIIHVLRGSVYVNDVLLEAGYVMRVYDGELMIYEVEPIDYYELDSFQLAAVEDSRYALAGLFRDSGPDEAFEPVNEDEMSLRNRISDISPLAGLTNLTSSIFLRGPAMPAGRFYPDMLAGAEAVAGITTVYEFHAGFRREVTHDMGIMRNTFRYSIRGNRLILTAGGESIEFRLGSDRTYFYGPLNMRFSLQD